MAGKRGRPERGTIENCKRVLSMISAGMSARRATESLGISLQAFLEGVERHGIGDQYARAMYERAALLAEEALEISDDVSGDVQRDRLRVDTRKWFAARLDPKKWGDKLSAEVTGKDGAPLIPPEVKFVRDTPDA